MKTKLEKTYEDKYQEKEAKTLAIVGICIAWFSSAAGIALSIIALTKAKQKTTRTLAISSLVVSIISLIADVLLILEAL